MCSTTLGVILVIYAVILWMLLFFAWRRGYQEWKRNRAGRLQRFSARVIETRENILPSKGSEARPAVERLLTFQFDGRQGEYKVESATYEAARVGQEGTLYLSSGRFERFEPKSGSEEAEDVYRRVVGS
ncbi:MAG TPA: DUF2500 family protein [Armatimonadota bacterium]|nr:DUF2500 family protein [Armatimonadota bacterium]